MKIIILGLGNPILSDDGVGIKIAQELKDIVHEPGITIAESSLSGISLLELLFDYDRAIIIDAIQTEKGKAGCIYHLGLNDIEESRHTASCHGINLANAIRLGKQLNYKLPQQIDIFAIEAADVSTFSEELTPDVREAVSSCINMLADELGIQLVYKDKCK
jgi:hydrogenase maturation protease